MSSRSDNLISAISLRQLRYLAALAQHEHFGRAAAACSVTQPALSMQIKELERELKVVLIERRRQGMQLTEEGGEVARRAARIVTDVRDLVDYAHHRNSTLSGPLHLGVIPSVAAMVRVGDLISPQALTTPAAIPMQDSTGPASKGSATPDEDSSMNDFGECTGCKQGERGGMRSDLQQSNPALKQVPIGADDEGPVTEVKKMNQDPTAIPSRFHLPTDRPRPTLVG